MLMVKYVMVVVFRLAKVFQLIQEVLHIILNFQPIKEIRTLVTTSRCVSFEVSVCGELFHARSEISKHRPILAVQMDNL
jgi:hypothetical protein